MSHRSAGIGGPSRSPVTDLPTPLWNHLLATVPDEDRRRIYAHLEPVWLPLGMALHEPGAQMASVYFPTTAIVSLQCELENGASAEVSVIGNEGIVGIELFMGTDSMPNRPVVVSAGHAYRLRGPLLKDEFAHTEAVHRLLHRYTMALLTQMAQTAVCNRHHSVDQRLCGWFLHSLDRLPTTQLAMTHELIASMLGVRREGVTVAAGRLQDAGLISYHRGVITVLDRCGLEARVCECYEIIRKEFERLLP